MRLSSHEGGGGWPGGVGGLPPGPLGSASLFGDGSYSGNIIQSGSVLQPNAAGIITITGAATVAPDSGTGAAVFMCRSLVLNGASASLTALINCKGLIGFVKEGITSINGATLHMTQKGKAGNFGKLDAYSLAPASFQGKLKRSAIEVYAVQAEGAAAGATGNAWNNPAPGLAAGAMQTGGGGQGPGNGQALNWSAGKGGPCCGGAGSGAGTSGYAAGDYGGPGGAGYGDMAHGYGGGAGDPPGAGWNYNGSGNPGSGPGGGLLMLFTPRFTNNSGCVVASDGGVGGSAANCAGGSAGGGCVVIVTKPGGYTNVGTVRANGGPRTSSPVSGGAGGAGSVNIFQDAA